VAAAEYKQLTQRVLAELADGNGQPFMDALTNGARALVADRRGRPGDHRRADAPAVSPVRQHQYKARATRIAAEDDLAVVEARGEATTKSGKPYNQTYCYVFQLTDGKARELTEYLDTNLVNQVLDTPAGP
jgi:uncharacterized protein